MWFPIFPRVCLTEPPFSNVGFNVASQLTRIIWTLLHLYQYCLARENSIYNQSKLFLAPFLQTKKVDRSLRWVLSFPPLPCSLQAPSQPGSTVFIWPRPTIRAVRRCCYPANQVRFSSHCRLHSRFLPFFSETVFYITYLKHSSEEM